MRNVSVSFAVWGLAFLSSASPAPGQEPRGGVVRTEIYNGATRTVRYNAPGLSPGEVQSLRELERLENESNYVRELDSLKREYVASERALEPYRRSVQQSLYGMDTTTSSYGGFAAPFAYPNAFGGFYGAYTGWGSPYAGYGSYGLYGGDRTTVTRSLATGVGDEGALKTALSKTIAQQATAEYASALDRSAERAFARASTSPTLRVAMGLRADDRGRPGDIRPVADDASPVTLTLKDGATLRGTKVEDRGGWMYVTQSGGRQVRVRESEVVRVETAAGGVKPASGD